MTGTKASAISRHRCALLKLQPPKRSYLYPYTRMSLRRYPLYPFALNALPRYRPFTNAALRASCGARPSQRDWGERRGSALALVANHSPH
eukprot:4100751-Pleurochrysis_carterae.AAC.2